LSLYNSCRLCEDLALVRKQRCGPLAVEMPGWASLLILSIYGIRRSVGDTEFDTLKAKTHRELNDVAFIDDSEAVDIGSRMGLASGKYCFRSDIEDTSYFRK
jgi:hypothetical protein